MHVHADGRQGKGQNVCLCVCVCWGRVGREKSFSLLEEANAGLNYRNKVRKTCILFSEFYQIWTVATITRNSYGKILIIEMLEERNLEHPDLRLYGTGL